MMVALNSNSDLLQAHSTMHSGHPCPKLSPHEYFKDGITNGAQWYSVAGNLTNSQFLKLCEN